MAKRVYSIEDRTRGLQALADCGGNLAEASRRTGIPRKTLAGWAKGQELPPPHPPASPPSTSGSPPDPPLGPPLADGENCREFMWTEPRQLAARLAAEDELTDVEIAARVGISPACLYLWKAAPEFQARVKEIVGKLGEVSQRYAITRRTRRLQGYDDRRNRLLQVIEERAAARHLQDAAGGKTGLVVRQEKMIGSGDSAEKVEEFSVDTATLKALLDLEKQAATDAGQWDDKPGVGVSVTVIGGIDLDVVVGRKPAPPRGPASIPPAGPEEAASGNPT